MTKVQVYKVGILAVFGLLISACGSPKHEFNRVIAEQGYIAYTAPLAAAGVGTIIDDNPDSLGVIAHPERCFPRNSDRPLVGVSETSLPSSYKKFKLGFGAELNDILRAGNEILGFNLGFNRVKEVEVRFEGATIEYLDQVNFLRHYNQFLDEACREVLSDSYFILQALRVEKMSFKFYSRSGTKVELTPGVADGLISVGTEWEVENRYTLVVDSPKYIGYHVGFMDGEEKGRVSHRAVRAIDGEFDFDETDFVPQPAPRNNVPGPNNRLR